jgi:hypothetical protein
MDMEVFDNPILETSANVEEKVASRAIFGGN